MKLTGNRATTFLSKPKDDVIGVLFFGPDRGLARERAKSLSKKYIPEADAFSVTTLTADDLSGDTAKLADEMSALSLLGDARLVHLRLDHERNGAAISKIIKSLDANPKLAAAKLIVEAGDMTPRSAVRKSFEAAGNFVAIGCYTDSTADISNLVRTSLNEKSIGIDADALALWTPLLEGDRALTRGEIEKMILYKGDGMTPGEMVSMDDIRNVAAGGQVASIDDIIQSAMSGDVDACDYAYRTAMAGKMNSAVILRSLQRHITRLLEAHAHMSSGDSIESAMRSLRPPVFRMQERAFMGQVRKWRQTMLQKVLSQSLEAERQVKTAGSPADAIVGRLLLALGTYAARQR